MHRAVYGLARAMALIGGAVLTLLILLIVLSVLGRVLNGALHGGIAQIAPVFAQRMLERGVGPINGDFELVEAGIAFSIFAFLPLCQITSGHATVDIFVSRLPAGLNRFLRALIEVAFGLVLILIAWRLFEGMMSKRGYGETTFLLQFPIWWAYLASLIGAVVAAFVGAYTAAVRVAEMITGQVYLPDGPEADH